MTREEKLFLILSCIGNLENPTITRIQKSMFIYTQEYDENLLLYVPNNYGPNSFELKDEITFLVSNNYLSVNNNKGFSQYFIDAKGNKILSNVNLIKKYYHKQQILKEIMSYVNIMDKWLVDYVYRWYPKFTSQSLIAHDVIERMTDERKQDADTIIQDLKRKLQKIKS